MNFEGNTYTNPDSNADARVDDLIQKFPELAPRIQDDHFRESLLGESALISKPEDLSRFIHNYDLRLASRSDKDLLDRLNNNPYATEEELAAGVYKEDMESQVRDSVFEFMRKGYDTFESGFYTLTLGTQMIGFSAVTDSEFSNLKENLSKVKADEFLIEVIRGDDRDKIVVTPRKDMTLEELKQTWDIITKNIPTLNKSGANKKTEAGRAFRSKDEKIKQGKDTYVGSRIYFKGGKFVIES